MFKAARNRLIEEKATTKDDAPSYFIECLLYNVPDGLFKSKLAPRYAATVDWLKIADFQGFKCRNGRVGLFGPGREWTVEKARKLVRAMQGLGDVGGAGTESESDRRSRGDLTRRLLQI